MLVQYCIFFLGEEHSTIKEETHKMTEKLYDMLCEKQMNINKLQQKSRAIRNRIRQSLRCPQRNGIRNENILSSSVDDIAAYNNMINIYNNHMTYIITSLINNIKNFKCEDSDKLLKRFYKYDSHYCNNPIGHKETTRQARVEIFFHLNTIISWIFSIINFIFLLILFMLISMIIILYKSLIGIFIVIYIITMMILLIISIDIFLKAKMSRTKICFFYTLRLQMSLYNMPYSDD